MENRAISDAQITSSSQLGNRYSAAQARLYSKADKNNQGGWVALKNDLSQWLQVDFGTYTTVIRVATQGRYGHDQWVTKYRLQYSEDGYTFHFFEVSNGNSAKVRCMRVVSYSPFDQWHTKTTIKVSFSNFLHGW